MRVTSHIVTLAGLVASLAAGGTLAGCGSYTADVQGSGVITTDTRDASALEGVSRVSLEGSSNVTITIDPEAERSIVVETDDNLHEFIRTYVEDGTLVVTSDGSYSTSHGVRVTLVLSALDAASLAGSGDIHVEGITADRFVANLAGSGDIFLAGTTQHAKLSVAGSGDIHAMKLTATDADVSVAGSGDIEFKGTGDAKVAITGSGDVTCHGKPANLVQTVLGSGDIRIK